MCISKIPFLYNVEEGKNNGWRYLITIIATWGVQAVAAIGLMVLFLVFLIMQNGTSSYGLNGGLDIESNWLFLLTATLAGFSLSYLFFYLCGRVIHHRKFISFITTKSRINWMRILKGAVVWLSILVILTVISFLANPSSYKVTFDPGTFGILLIISLILFPIQASFEEVFFRGYLMQGFSLLSKKPVIPILATSIIFGIGHVANGANMTISIFPLIETIIIGIMLGVITLGEDSLETAIGIHVTNNIFAVLIVSTSGGIFGNLPSILSNSPDPFSELIWIITAAAAAIIVIFWNKKDKLLDIFRWEDAEPY